MEGKVIDQTTEREISKIRPLGKMWPDDRHWLPLVLQGKQISAEFIFDQEMNITEFNIHEK